MKAAQPALMAAQAVAMRAMIDDLTQMDVDDMRNLAEELLDTDLAIYRAVTGFATQYDLARHDPEALAMQGRILRDAVLAAVGSGPVLAERRDIDG